MLTIEQAEQFKSGMDQGALLLTPNHQLAVALHETWGNILRGTNSSCVGASPRIRAIDMWVREVWQAQVISGSHEKSHWQLLDSAEEQLIWHDIIASSDDTGTLLNPGDCTKAASQAATLMTQYFLTSEHIAEWLRINWPTPEERLDLSSFLNWHNSYIALKQNRELLSLSDLVILVTELVKCGQVPLPEILLTFGFTDPPPLYQQLLDTLGSKLETCRLNLSSLSPEISVSPHRNVQQEIAAAAQWAENTLQNNPGAKVAIICPDLSTRSEQIYRTFADFPILAQQTEKAIKSSTGKFMISGAVSLLKLNLPLLNTLDLCRILRSPWFSENSQEQSARAFLEFKLRKYGEYEVSPAQVRYLCHQKDQDHYCPDLGDRLQHFAESARTCQNKNLSPHGWLLIFEQQLDILGWPGNRELNSSETANLEIWKNIQDLFLSTSGFRHELSLIEAINCLEQLAQQYRYEQHSVTDRLCIFSAEEAEHLQFSHLLIMGVNEQLWPPDANPNPLLPFKLQRKFSLPGTDKSGHVEQYEALLKQLSTNAREQVCISYALLHDELEARPSPALLQFGPLPNAPAEPENDQFSMAVNRLRNTVDLELINSEALLPLPEHTNPGGGKSLLQNQAWCPFKSFAIHRLHAEELNTPTYGLNPMVSGILLHSVLESVWGELATYEALLALDADEKMDLACNASKSAVTRLVKRYPQILQPRYRALEEERLTALVLEWLNIEEAREFTSVEALEQEFVWTHGTLSLSLKVDRIDRNYRNKLEVIDYKSGRPASILWQDERPQQPQLMLYLLAVEEHYGENTVSALLHAWVSVGNFSFQFIDEGQTGNIPPAGRQGVYLEWDLIRDHWKQALEALADEFISGLHSVTPCKSSYCQQCHVRPFCRIDTDISLESEVTEDSESGSDYEL